MDVKTLADAAAEAEANNLPLIATVPAGTPDPGFWVTATPHVMPVSILTEEIDPVTFEPYPEDAPVVELGLTYDSTPQRDAVGFTRAGWGIPVWLVILGGAYVVANYAGGRI
jgi:hypothetical protein